MSDRRDLLVKQVTEVLLREDNMLTLEKLQEMYKVLMEKVYISYRSPG